ncbi:MAG: hypothetical protein PF574_04295 [Candidatus Delongbacteria bacterium]|nr:hypothetical protein [Candidatus Delongbacteria bacterium]
MNKYLLLLIVLFHTFLFSSDLFSLTSFTNEFYYFDGFESNLKIYNSSNKLIDSMDLSNACKGATADYFIKYDKLKNYLFSSISGIMYLLDENYNLTSILDLNKLFSLNFVDKVYPINYNSLLVASEDLDKFYILENKELSEILTFSDIPVDFFFDSDKIFILFNDRVEIYSSSGVYGRFVPFKIIEEPTQLVYSESKIFIKHKAGIERVNVRDRNKNQYKIEYQTRVIEENDIQDFAVIGNQIALLKGNKIIFRTIK